MAARDMAHGSQELGVPRLAGRHALGLALGVVLVLLARQSGVYGLAIGLFAGGLVGVGRARGARRLLILEQAIGYLVCLWWLGPPSLLTLGVGFWLMGFLELYPLPLVKHWRQAGTRGGLLLGQFMNGIIGLASLSCLRLTLVPELWNMAK